MGNPRKPQTEIFQADFTPPEEFQVPNLIETANDIQSREGNEESDQTIPMKLIIEKPIIEIDPKIPQESPINPSSPEINPEIGDDEILPISDPGSSGGIEQYHPFNPEKSGSDEDTEPAIIEPSEKKHIISIPHNDELDAMYGRYNKFSCSNNNRNERKAA